MTPQTLPVLLIGSALKRLAELPAQSVGCCVTSPPFYGLRSYLDADDEAKAHEIGLEQTPAEYVQNLVDVFAQVHRVLKDDGTCWINLGDSYANDGKWGGSSGGKHAAGLHGKTGIGRGKRDTGFKPKDLMQIPHRVSIALQDWGWYVRSEIVWAKPNPMPESVTDRPTRSHEYIFLLTKSERYFYDADAIREQGAGRTDLWPMDKIGRLGGPGGWSKSQKTDPTRNAARFGTFLSQTSKTRILLSFPKKSRAVVSLPVRGPVIRF